MHPVLKKLFNRRNMAILAGLAIVAVILAPNGFFSGHRTVTLEGDVFVSTAEVKESSTT